MDCRPGCGACCSAPSINRPFFGMPAGKPAGVRCVHLDAQFLCRLFGQPERPEVCSRFQADPAVCGASREEALQLISWWEQATA